jgi:hypothetical protein
MARGRSTWRFDEINVGANDGQANVMLSYPIDEAEELLSSKLAAAKQNLANCEEDHDFLREQITVKHHSITFLCAYI